MVRLAQPLPDGLQLGNIQKILRPASALLHGYQILNGRDEKRSVTDRHADRASPQLLEVVAFADNQINFGTSVWRAEIHRRAPRSWLQTRHDIQVDRTGATPVQSMSSCSSGGMMSILPAIRRQLNCVARRVPVQAQSCFSTVS